MSCARWSCRAPAGGVGAPGVLVIGAVVGLAAEIAAGLSSEPSSSASSSSTLSAAPRP